MIIWDILLTLDNPEKEKANKNIGKWQRKRCNIAIYEFRCDACGRIMEESLPMTSKKEITVCIHCDEYGAKRIISQSTFVLKGGGWYADAYNKKEA